jgi:hypothetical protein
MKYIFLIVAFVFTVPAFANVKVSTTKILQNKFLLGDKETDMLKKEFTKQKFNYETFTLQFVCDKYKKSPSAKDRTLNCRAVTISPDVN